MLRTSLFLLIVLLSTWLLSTPSLAGAQPRCAFTLGFKALHDLIPRTVGDCLEDEHHNPDNGDGLQQTSGGLLVWRKADNWTAFTDGSTTWLNGPQGLQSRPNAGPPFPWEGQAPTPAARRVSVYFSHHPETDADFTAVRPVDRPAPDAGVARAALEYLIAGPTPAERANGYFSELGDMLNGPSTCGGADFALTIDAGLATVRFCREIGSAGIGQDARTQAQITTTLEQFPTIQRVRLLTSTGQCLFDESGLDLCLRR